LFSQSVKANCAEEPETIKDGVYLRKLLGAMHNAGVKAMYGAAYDPISEDCFGDWIDPMWAPIHDAFHKMHDDLFSPTYEDWARAGKAWLDISYKNMDECQFKKIGDDWKHWCLENPGTCFRWDDGPGRVAGQFFPII